jgi:holo-[acyl-carrier protein] synthase
MAIIGTGVDITEVRRLRQAVERWGKQFLERVFTGEELKNAEKHASFYQHLAGRFAAKEAVFKAFSDSSLTWKDVQIVNDEEGRPWCRILNGKACGKKVHVSISHVKSYAVANAFVEKES